MRTRALGLVLGYLADRAVGDPRRFHPVAGFGAVAARLEQRVYARSHSRGAMHVAVLVGGATALGAVAERLAPRRTAHVGATALATWAVLGGRSLQQEAEAVHELLAAGDLSAARARLTHLVGRETSTLDEAGIARAVVESLAENTSDAVVAPLLWGAVAGIPGLLGYRAANTLDAMVGHRSPRYERFGWAAARLDDLANVPGSRLAGAATLLASPRTAPAAAAAWRRDAAAHPSPNAGVVESAFAGALGLRLGGTNRYGARVEHRAVMGDGRAPAVSDVPSATRLANRVGAVSLVVSALVAIVMGSHTTAAQRREPAACR